jgi:hypothetical protein
VQAKTDAKGQFSVIILKGQKGTILGSIYSYSGEFENCPKLGKLLEAKKASSGEIETSAAEIEANNDLNGVELEFPFPNCQKAR